MRTFYFLPKSVKTFFLGFHGFRNKEKLKCLQQTCADCSRNRKILRSVIVRPDLDNVFRGDFGKGLEPGDASLRLIFADAAAKVKLAVSDIDCSVESLPE